MKHTSQKEIEGALKGLSMDNITIVSVGPLK